MIKQSYSYIDVGKLVGKFPTHKHDNEFWECLGRAVATFGFLEEVLGKAIFALTNSKLYKEDEIQVAYNNWTPIVENALSGTLPSLIKSYEKALNDRPDIRVMMR
jgi:hypothetical protein